MTNVMKMGGFFKAYHTETANLYNNGNTTNDWLLGIAARSQHNTDE